MVQENIKLTVTSSPHLSSPETTRRVMLDVIIALVPALIAAVAVFGIRALTVTVFSVLFCVLTELVICRFFNMPLRTADLSAVVTGILLAFVLPPGVPIWVLLVGAVVSIGITKMVFGGLGNNLFNPALTGRAFLLASWPALITTWSMPDLLKPLKFKFAADYMAHTVTGATPLSIVKEGGFNYDFTQLPSMMDMFLGNMAGSIGETSVLAILIGAFYLFMRRQITWHIPIPYVVTVFALTFIYNGSAFLNIQSAFFHIMAGGLMLGAFFMATDMVTSPVTPKGQIIFGVSAGVIVYLIRLFGAYPEGVCYSILIMNAFVPLIDRWTRPKVFGEVK
jgi:electron transport complex protein RnfD